MAVVEPGGKAPAFSLPDQEGTVHRLRDYAGRPLIPLLLSQGRHARLYPGGVRVPRRAARTYMGVARMTYLIGPDGRIARRWDDVEVDGHAADLLRAVDER